MSITVKILSYDRESAVEPDDCMYQVVYTGHDGISTQYGMTASLIGSIWETGEYPEEFDRFHGFIEALQAIYCTSWRDEDGCLVGAECELKRPW